MNFATQDAMIACFHAEKTPELMFQFDKIDETQSILGFNDKHIIQ